MRPATGYFFEDYAVGQKFVHAIPRTITHGDTALYQALTGSRNPLHCSEPFAQSLGYPTTPVDDLLVFHIAFGKTVPDVSYNAVANLGYAECRFVQPVFVGDTLRAESEVVGLKPNSNGKTGVVYLRSNGYNQRDELVLTWVRWVMVHRQTAVSPEVVDTPRGTLTFQAIPDPKLIAAPAAFDLSAEAIARTTGGSKFWEDYIAVDRTDKQDPFEILTTLPHQHIPHPAGITIDETDHTLATKLYQNTARVHFDLHHMTGSRFGKRLIYGGQIISIARALSFDGFENALAIAAINAGSHLNPTFAGDTIYAASMPLMKWPVSDRLGALRVGLMAFKNIDPSSPTFASAPPDSKVLSMDLTLLVPRRR
ncbi:MAG: MaoC family dehydratase N-terminal domain-containing protein [Rhodocyclaceae bacterium]|nr:MaoC family dehydratase N-terminal domain-containing protein [Rhodocyclaceae bacterium]